MARGYLRGGGGGGYVNSHTRQKWSGIDAGVTSESATTYACTYDFKIFKGTMLIVTNYAIFNYWASFTRNLCKIIFDVVTTFPHTQIAIIRNSINNCRYLL